MLPPRKHILRWAAAIALCTASALVLIAPVGSVATRSCRVCAKKEARYFLFGSPVGNSPVEEDTFQGWFDRYVHVPHEHDWVPRACDRGRIPLFRIVQALWDPEYDPRTSAASFGLPTDSRLFPSRFEEALRVMPDRAVAIHLATRVARASSSERLNLLGTWGTETLCPAIDTTFLRPLKMATGPIAEVDAGVFDRDYEAWLRCHPEWR